MMYDDVFVLITGSMIKCGKEEIKKFVLTNLRRIFNLHILHSRSMVSLDTIKLFR